MTTELISREFHPMASRTAETTKPEQPTTGCRTTSEGTPRGPRLQRAVARFQRRIARLEEIGTHFFRVRLVLFLGGFTAATAAFLGIGPIWGWSLLLVWTLALVVVAWFHARLKASLRRHHLWVAIKKSHLARIDLDWDAISPAQASAKQARHPFERDLDITGPQSLHQLLDCCLSEGGSELLREWLLRERPDPPEIWRRQELVAELTPLSLFRDRLALCGALSSTRSGAEKVGSKALFEWLRNESEGVRLARALLVQTPLVAATIALLALHLHGWAPALWPISALASVAFLLSQQMHVETLFGDGLWLERTISRYRRVFEHLENFQRPAGSHLAKLCGPFFDGRTRPSKRLGKVARLVGALSVRAYFPAWIFVNLLFPWDFFFAMRLQKQKDDLARLLPRWLQVWFELEAANSLACFNWLHPDYATPVLEAGMAGLAAEGLGHPLIPSRQRVCNDFSLIGLGRIVIVTGSNMAGKSTFLRTVGINLCLAQAGAAVCARSLHCSPFRLSACIRVSDSLADGFSYFYAEVRRLKGMLDELARADRIPLLFLIDEIFKGTNNRERLIGSRSFIRALVNRNGLGLISTHDLDLVRLSEELESVSNRHFREEVIDGRMRFDYVLREGPCPTTNALEIMRLEGLPVEGAD